MDGNIPVFGFKLKESSNFMRDLYKDHHGHDPACWGTLYKKYLAVKGPLIKAIDPDTARAVREVTATVRASNVVSSFRAAFGGLSSFISAISDGEILNNAIAKDSTVLSAHPSRAVGIKAGMKLTKALRRWYINCNGKGSEKSADAWLAQQEPQWKIRTTEMKLTLVLSANLADIMMCSHPETSAFESCHKLGGQHEKGPLQYVCDPGVAVAYLVHELREFRGVKWPYKTWRQLVHFDVSNKSIWLMRQYPSDHTPSLAPHLIEIAKPILETLCGEPLPATLIEHSYRQIRCEEEKVGLAYIDKDYARVHSVARPTVDNYVYTLASQIPCPFCGNKFKGGNFKCGVVYGASCGCIKHPSACAEEGCTRKIGSGTPAVNADGKHICRECSQNYYTCFACQKLTRKRDGTDVLDDRNRRICCFKGKAFRCQACLIRRDEYTSRYDLSLSGSRTAICARCRNSYDDYRHAKVLAEPAAVREARKKEAADATDAAPKSPVRATAALSGAVTTTTTTTTTLDITEVDDEPEHDDDDYTDDDEESGDDSEDADDEDA